MLPLPILLAEVLSAFPDGDLAVVAMGQSGKKGLQGQTARTAASKRKLVQAYIMIRW